jgi:hypothetical protein
MEATPRLMLEACAKSGLLTALALHKVSFTSPLSLRD